MARSIYNCKSAVMIFKDFGVTYVPLLHTVATVIDTAFPLRIEYYFLCLSATTGSDNEKKKRNNKKKRNKSIDKDTFKTHSRYAKFFYCVESKLYAKKLVEMGFVARYLPVSIGGSWKGSMHNNINDTIGNVKSSKEGNGENTRSKSANSNTEANASTEEGFAYMKKIEYRIARRERREKGNQEFNELKKAASEEKLLNAELKTEHARLQDLLRQANNAVVEYTDGYDVDNHEKAEKLRPANAAQGTITDGNESDVRRQ